MILNVLVTGASTGIGRAVVERLAARGDRVFAGARDATDLADLDAIEGVTALRLDVTNRDDVAAAVEAIGRLDALVNNAGIAVPAPLVELETDTLVSQLDVNLVGVHRLVRACFPALSASGGRIVQISSTNGLAGAEFLGAYCASKRALEGYSDVLRREVTPFGVHVAVVCPGSFRSQAWPKGLAAARERLEDSVYRGPLGAAVAQLEAMIALLPPPTPVVDAVEHAIHADTPRRRYVPAADPAFDEILDQIEILRAEVEAAREPTD